MLIDGIVPARAEWIGGALERGAAEVWCDPTLPGLEVWLADADAAVRIRPIPDLIDRIGELASDWYGRPQERLTTFGVTGTNGKTSTVQLLAQAWAELGIRSATIGTLGAAMHGDELTLNGYTTPPITRLHELLAEFLARGATHVAIEVSSHALEEQRVDGIEFAAVHYSNLTRDHLDYHGSMEHYAAQKAKIYDLPGAPLAIGNLDDPEVRMRWEALPAGRARVGLTSRGAAGAQLRAEDVRFDRDVTRFQLVAPEGRIEITTPLIGRFNVDNLLAVIAELRREGVDLDTIARIIPKLRPPFGRMWRIHPDPSLPMIVVDAGHTPDAMRQALAAIGEYGYERIITVFGATGDRDPGKRPEMARYVEAGSDIVIVTDDDVHDDDGDQIVAQLLAAMERPDAAFVERDRTSAVRLALSMATADDVILLAGKGHEPFQIVAGDEHVPYSDIETAERLARELLESRGA